MSTQTPAFRSGSGKGGLLWVAREDLASRLLRDGEFLPPGSLLRDWELKRSGSRRVRAVDLAGGPPAALVVKTYPARPFPEGIFRGWLYPSQARLEMDNGLRILERGISVPAPVAALWRPAGILTCESILVSERIEPAWDLHGILHGSVPPKGRARGRISRALGDLFRRMHDGGITHDDPHLGNILLAGGAMEPRVIPIDLRRVRIRRGPLDLCQRAGNLALLGLSVRGLASKTDLLRFLNAYLAAPGLEERQESLAQGIAAAQPRILLDIARGRARRALRDGRRFQRIERLGITWQVRREARSPGLDAILADPEGFFRDPARIIKDSRSGTVACAGGIVVKRIRQKRLRNLILDRLRCGRARRGLYRAVILDVLGIPTATVLASGERRRCGLVTAGYIVQEEVPGARTFLAWAREASGAQGSPEIPEAAGRLIACLHQAGLTHRDLKAPNILLDGNGDLCLVDLDGLRAPGRVSERRAARDLARFLRDLVTDPAVPEDMAGRVTSAYCRQRHVDREHLEGLLQR